MQYNSILTYYIGSSELAAVWSTACTNCRIWCACGEGRSCCFCMLLLAVMFVVIVVYAVCCMLAV